MGASMSGRSIYSLTKSIVTKSLNRIIHSVSPVTFGFLPRTRRDYRQQVGNGLESNVFMAPLRFIMRNFVQATLVVQKDEDVEFDHPMLELIKKPNRFYSGTDLWRATIMSWAQDGNAYWLCLRNRLGMPVQLWYIPHFLIEPKWDDNGNEFITHYEYRPSTNTGTPIIRIEPEDIVHFREGLDPDNLRKGMGILKPLYREIFTDDEAANYAASMLNNMGVPGLVISPEKDMAIDSADAESTKLFIKDKFSGDGRGQALVMKGATKVSTFGFNPKDMDLGAIRNIPEERVCAMLGMPAAVVGFGTGLQSSKVGATMNALIRLAWTGCISPLQDMFAETLGNSALAVAFDVAESLKWDRSEVEALQDNEDEKAKRAGQLVKDGIIMISEGRTMTGFESDDSHRIFLRPINVIEVPEGETAAEQEDPPAEELPALPAPDPDASADDDDAGEEGAAAAGSPSLKTVKKFASGGRVDPKKIIVVGDSSCVMPAGDLHKVMQEHFGKDVQVFIGHDEFEVLSERVAKQLVALTHKDSPLDEEQNVLANSPHAKPADWQLALIRSLDRFGLRHSDVMLKDLLKFMDQLGADAARAALEVLEEPEEPKGKKPKKGQKYDERLQRYRCDLRAKQEDQIGIETDAVIEAMALADASEDLKKRYAKAYLLTADIVFKETEAAVGLGVNLPDKVARDIAAIGERRTLLVRLPETTRARVFQEIARGRELGEGVEAIARRLRDKVPAGPWSSPEVRARVIAKTEIKFAQNASMTQFGRQVPGAQMLVFDARAGQTDEVCLGIDGAVVTIEQADQLAIEEHPRGTRSFSIHLEN